MISKENLASIVRRYGVLFALLIVFAVFSFMEPTFYSVRNILSIIRQASITGILAIGLTTVVIAGEFDMSFASLAGFSGVLSLILMGKVFMGAIPAWILSVLAALGIGALNGLIILFIGVPSIITTIGMMTLLAGFTKWLTGGSTYYAAKFPDIFPFLGRSFLFEIVPMPVVIFGIVIAVYVVLLEHTKIGRFFHAVGGNPKASEHVGIKVRRVKFIALLISGFMAGLAGIMIGSLLGSGAPAMGDGYLMPGISAMFIGAVFLRDGVPNIWGTVIGSLLLSVLTNGFVMINLPFYMKEIVLGSVLIGAVSMVAIFKKGSIPGVNLL